MRYRKPDGVIHFEASGCCCPPGDKHKGVHTRGFTFWYRINNGEWRHVPANAEHIAESSKTVEEFRSQVL